MFLVLLETSGNQNYIFSTNKLKENFGASELTYLAGTKWVLQAIEASGHRSLWDEDVQILRQNLLNPDQNPPIEAGKADVEVVVAASGKAVLLVRDQETAQEIVSRVTETALQEAPGIDLQGAVGSFEWNAASLKIDELGEAIKQIHRRAAQIHNERPGVATRFLQLPIIAQCATSGLPASQFVPAPGENNGWIGKSIVSLEKENAATTAFDRINRLIATNSASRNLRLARKIDQLEEAIGETDWLSVIHADGNGLGEIFLNFDQHLCHARSEEQTTYRDYVNAYREFSIALDVCTQNAFLEAVGQTFKDRQQERLIPLVPLVLGGDDLTVICGGQHALNFTVAFLQAFERETGSTEIQNGIIPKIAAAALGRPRLSACAGIAIVKPHFPFSIAYQLSEALMQSAKTVKTIVQWDIPDSSCERRIYPCSALDFHVLYDSSNVDLDQIRKRLRVDANHTLLYNKPYVVTKLQQLEQSNSDSQDWAAHHHWQQLLNRVGALQAEAASEQPDRGRLLPRNQAHELRQSLFLGRGAADAYLKLIWQRYESGAPSELQPLIHSDRDGNISLFHSEDYPESPKLPKPRHITGFLDALEIAKLLNSDIPMQQ